MITTCPPKALLFGPWRPDLDKYLDRNLAMLSLRGTFSSIFHGIVSRKNTVQLLGSSVYGKPPLEAV